MELHHSRRWHWEECLRFQRVDAPLSVFDNCCKTFKEIWAKPFPLMGALKIFPVTAVCVVLLIWKKPPRDATGQSIASTSERPKNRKLDVISDVCDLTVLHLSTPRRAPQRHSAVLCHSQPQLVARVSQALPHVVFFLSAACFLFEARNVR